MVGCVPIVNLFKSTMEPKRLLPTEYEYQLSPQYQDAESNEVVSISDVTLRNWNKTYEHLPCYHSGEHTHYMSASEVYWLMRREDKNWPVATMSLVERLMFLLLISNTSCSA